MAFKAKSKIHLYYNKVVDGVDTSKKVDLTPSSIKITYSDIMSNKDSWDATFYEDKLYKKNVYKTKGKGKKKKKKLIHKKGSVEKSNVTRNYNLTGTSNKDYLKGYKTTVTLHFNIMTEEQLRTLCLVARQRYSQLLTFKATYKDINGHKQTDSYQDTMVMDRLQMAFYEPACGGFCKTWFSMSDLTFETSLKKNKQFIYEGVDVTFTTLYARKPRSSYCGLGGTYSWQDTTTSKWKKNAKPTHFDRNFFV